jgi:hypothetical protein
VVKTEYTLNPITPFIHTDAAVADEKMDSVHGCKNNTIDNENETHLEIFFYFASFFSVLVEAQETTQKKHFRE